MIDIITLFFIEIIPKYIQLTGLFRACRIILLNQHSKSFSCGPNDVLYTVHLFARKLTNQG